MLIKNSSSSTNIIKLISAIAQTNAILIKHKKLTQRGIVNKTVTFHLVNGCLVRMQQGGGNLLCKRALKWVLLKMFHQLLKTCPVISTYSANFVTGDAIKAPYNHLAPFLQKARLSICLSVQTAAQCITGCQLVRRMFILYI